uniref:Peptidase S1 domain-containing protein n=1 Tax=Ditylenchus dipsaci TaxID=166011 RepID=A0A915E8R9_9BILA
MIDLSLYLDDFCGYLGLCTPSSDGLYKLLSLDSLYFPEIQTKPDMAPFRPVAANYFTYDCKERGNASLIDDNQQVVCENVMWVSSQHLVTTRDCLSNLKPWLSGVGVLRVLTTKNTDYLVEFVAWSSTHSIAIVQLIEDTEEIVCLPSSTTLKPFLGSFCIYLNLCSNQQHLIHNSLSYFNHFFYSSTQSVGPKNWLIKLNETEQVNYTEQCVSHSASVQNRIVGGKVAKQGQFPFAAVLIYKYDYDTRCGGSIISPWHILTARHCIDGDQESFDILIGGVCYNRDNRDCAQVDMITVSYEFAIFDSVTEIFPSYGDFAIIQLKQKIPEHLFASGAVDIVCLSQTHQNPELIQSIGWGVYIIVNKIKSLFGSMVLRYATLETWIDPWFNSTIFIAARPPRSSSNIEVGGLPGDSGGAAVVYSQKLNKFVLHGILNNRGAYESGQEGVLNWYLKISIFTGDFCFYLNICYSKPTKNFKPVLAMGGFAFHSKKRSSFKSLPPFELISEEDRHKILDDCKLMQQQNQESNACALNLPWNAELVDGNGKVCAHLLL